MHYLTFETHENWFATFSFVHSILRGPCHQYKMWIPKRPLVSFVNLEILLHTVFFWSLMKLMNECWYQGNTWRALAAERDGISLHWTTCCFITNFSLSTKNFCKWSLFSLKTFMLAHTQNVQKGFSPWGNISFNGMQWWFNALNFSAHSSHGSK